MWEPRRLTTLWAFTASYRDSFTFLPYLKEIAYDDVYWIHPAQDRDQRPAVVNTVMNFRFL
jgi:hypothetical protein